MYTMNIPTLSLETKVVGMTFERRQSVVALLKVGEEVLLIREPDNPYDKNAIKVVRQNGQQFGFLNRYLAAMVSTMLDHYGRPISAVVSELGSGFYPDSSLGVRVKFDLPE
jgi:single-stranded-DNA-specific exonuclease